MSLYQLCHADNHSTNGRLQESGISVNDVTMSCTEIKSGEFIRKGDSYIYRIEPRKEDKVKPTHLVFHFENTAPDPAPDFSAGTYEIQINTMTLFRVPFSFLIQLNPPQIINGGYVLTIPFDDFWNDWLYPGATEYQPFYIVIKFPSPDQTPGTEKLKIVQFYKSMILYRKSKDRPKNTHVYLNQLSYSGIIPGESNMFEETSYSGMVKGFFLEADFPVKLTSLKISIVSPYEPTKYYVRQEYDQVMLALYVNQISDKLIYIPLDDGPYNETGPLSSVNALYFERSFGKDGLNMKLEITRESEGNIRLYYLTPNTLLYDAGGMTHMRYHS